MLAVIVVAFLRGCFEFYATIFSRYTENPDTPERPWTDGTD